MEPAAPIPSPSIAWSHLAASPAEAGPVDSFGGNATRRDEDASQLRARLLRLIVDREHTRKAGAESFHAR